VLADSTAVKGVRNNPTTEAIDNCPLSGDWEPGGWVLCDSRHSRQWRLAEDVSDADTIAGIRLLAETEGIFTETAGGVTTAVTRKLVEQGKIRSDETTVTCITGNGLKTLDALSGEGFDDVVIEPKLAAFETCLEEAAVQLV